MTSTHVSTLVLQAHRLRLVFRQGLRFFAHSPEPKKMQLEGPSFDALFTPEFRVVRDLFRKEKWDIRLAGGAVRDLVMGIQPADVDLATPVTPDDMRKVFEREGIRILDTKGEKHGTVACRINDCWNVEITTLRRDIVCDGRRAEVEFTTDWHQDALRRDLTINSMFCDLSGEVIDFFGGIEDLKKRRIAFVGCADDRIQEDYLRILRYFRFYNRIADKPDAHEKETLDAIKRRVDGMARNVFQQYIPRKISKERIWSETKKILQGKFPSQVMHTMIDVGLGPYLGFSQVEPNLEEYDKVCERSQALDPSPITLFAGLVRSKEQLYDLALFLKMSNSERMAGCFIVDNRDLLDGKEFGTACKTVQDLYLDQDQGDPSASVRTCELIKYAGRQDVLEHFEKWQVPKFPVNGSIIILEGGVRKGPAVKRSLIYLHKLWKESNYEMGKEALLERLSDLGLVEIELRPDVDADRKMKLLKMGTGV